MANPNDYDALMHGKKKVLKEDIIAYDQTKIQYFNIDDCMKDFYECETCGDLHGQGVKCNAHDQSPYKSDPDDNDDDIDNDEEEEEEEEEEELVIDDDVVFVEEQSE